MPKTFNRVGRIFKLTKMKTNFLISSIACFLAITVFFSCSKDIENLDSNQTNLIEFTQLAEQYTPANADQLKPTKEEIKEIIKEDIKGAEIGVKMGSAFGPWGMFVGGLLVGAANSYAHSGPAPGPQGGASWVSEAKYQDALTFHHNPANPYNEIGVKHNELLVFLADQQNSGALANPQNWNEIVDACVPYIHSNYPNGSGLLSDPSFMNMLYDSPNVDNSQLLSPNAQSIYDTYMQAIDFITDENDYYQFTTQYEHLVSNASIPNDDKDAILAALAVSRNSHAFWTNLFSAPVGPGISIFFQDIYCNGPSNFICLFPPTFPNPLPPDYVAGSISVDQSDISFELTETNLSNQTVNAILGSGSIRVAHQIEIDQSVLAQAHLQAGMPPSSDPVLLEPGTYPVVITGDTTNPNASIISIEIQTRVDTSGKRRWMITLNIG